MTEDRRNSIDLIVESPAGNVRTLVSFTRPTSGYCGSHNNNGWYPALMERIVQSWRRTTAATSTADYQLASIANSSKSKAQIIKKCNRHAAQSHQRKRLLARVPTVQW